MDETVRRRRLDRKRAQELGRLGGHAKAAKLKAARAPGPVDWSILELADRAGLVGDSWRAGRVLLKASEGLPLDPDELAVYQHHTGRERAPVGRPREIYEAAGRRSGKSLRAALKGVHAATCRRYTVASGERPVVLVLSADREQSKVVFRYVRGIIEAIPELRRLVVRRRKDQLELATGVDIHCVTSDYRLVRGRTCVLAICDEVSFWKSETSANPDFEVLNALRPSLATIPTAQLLAVSTVYSRAGALFAAFERYFATEDETVLFWRGTTAEMNPTVPADIIERALAEDPEAARAEWLAEWRSDVEALFPLATVRALVIPGRRELPPVENVRYWSFCDPSGGSVDSMTLCVCHAEKGVAVVDAIRERRPRFDPQTVVREFAATLKAYRVNSVTGDRFGGTWVQTAFADAGIEYRLSAESKSELYVKLVPVVNTGKLELLDHPTIVAQLAGLERRVSRGTGREIVDHGPHAHDDTANSIAGAALLALKDTELQIDGQAIAQANESFVTPGFATAFGSAWANVGRHQQSLFSARRTRFP